VSGQAIELRSCTPTCDRLFFIYSSWCFNWAPRHGGVWVEWKYSSTHSLTSALDGRNYNDSLNGIKKPEESVRMHINHLGTINQQSPCD